MQGKSMSQYLVELYSPNAAWLALPTARRRQFLDAIAGAMGGLASLGVEVLALAETERGLDQASPHRFLGIWRFPDTAARDALLAGNNASGWYGYFDQVNPASGAGGLESHLKALAEA
jgi:hypothetical protein